MRRYALIAGCLLAGLALALAGCRSRVGAPAGGLRLKPTPPDPTTAGAPMFQVRVVRLRHRLRPDAPVEDIWRLLGATNVPYGKRSLWEANDLRLGEGARLAASRMNDLLTETPDRSAKTDVLVVRENLDFAISVGGERDALELLWTDASGQLFGRRFEKAVGEFRLVCRPDPADPQAVRVAIAPEILYGDEQLRWVRTEGRRIQRMARGQFVLADLAAEVTLRPGRLLVIGGRRSSDLSLGGGLFYERRGPDIWSQTLILTAERAVPGAVPDAGGVPFLPKPE